MAALLDVASTGVSSGFVAGPTTINITHVCTGSNLGLVVFVSVFQDVAPTGTVSAMTYNGVAMTKSINPFNSANMSLEVWTLAAPASGSHTLAVTVTGATDGIRIEAASFTGVAQSNMVGATATGTGSSGNPALAITSLTPNSVLVSGLARFSTTAITATTWTNLGRHNTTNVTTNSDYLVTTGAGAQTDTMTGSAAQDFCIAAIELKPFVASSVNKGAAFLAALHA